MKYLIKELEEIIARLSEMDYIELENENGDCSSDLKMSHDMLYSLLNSKLKKINYLERSKGDIHNRLLSKARSYDGVVASHGKLYSENKVLKERVKQLELQKRVSIPSSVKGETKRRKYYQKLWKKKARAQKKAEIENKILERKLQDKERQIKELTLRMDTIKRNLTQTIMFADNRINHK